MWCAFPPSEYTCSWLSLYLTPSLKGEPNTPLPSRRSGRRAHRPPLQRRVGPPLQRERPLGPVHRQHLRSAAVAAGQRLRQRARHRQGLGSLGGVSGGHPPPPFQFPEFPASPGHVAQLDGGRGTARHCVVHSMQLLGVAMGESARVYQTQTVKTNPTAHPS